MDLLLDTHVFLWMIHDKSSISHSAFEAMGNLDNDLFLSAASYWEICIKINVGKLELGRNWKASLDRELEFNGIQWLPVQRQHAQGTCTLPGIHRDPFDRMLISQAKNERMALVSADRMIQQYPVKWIW